MGIIFIIISFIVWTFTGAVCTNILLNCNTYLSGKYADEYELFGKWNVAFMLFGPLVFFDFLVTLFVNIADDIKENKRILRNAKFKVGDRVTAKIYTYELKGKIAKVKVKDMGVIYNLDGLDSIDFIERNVKLDRKSRIDSLNI